MPGAHISPIYATYYTYIDTYVLSVRDIAESMENEATAMSEQKREKFVKLA
jgi:hypothetical protein